MVGRLDGEEEEGGEVSDEDAMDMKGVSGGERISGFICIAKR